MPSFFKFFLFHIISRIKKSENLQKLYVTQSEEAGLSCEKETFHITSWLLSCLTCYILSSLSFISFLISLILSPLYLFLFIFLCHYPSHFVYFSVLLCIYPPLFSICFVLFLNLSHSMPFLSHPLSLCISDSYWVFVPLFAFGCLCLSYCVNQIYF